MTNSITGTTNNEISYRIRNKKIKESLGSRIFDILNTFIMLIICFITLYPVLYVVAVSFSGNVAIMQNKVMFYPVDFNIEAYMKIFRDPMILRAYGNTVLYTVVGTFINLFFTTTMAYPLSRRGLTGKKFFMTLVVITLFFSGGMIPSFLLINSLKMYDTIWALVIPGAISTYNMIVVRTFFQSLPLELEESAKIDGASEIRIYFQIILPLSKAVIATIGLFYAVAHWNNFFVPLIYLKSKTKVPLQIILRNMLISAEMAEQNKLFSVDEQIVVAESIKAATIVVAVVPIICVYPFLQKYFVKGVMVGSIKG